ncbi:TetR/AcrR family transcriptional regulator [Pseudonocardia sp. TRM90224]|uniref:TetR/AcrR family transcriptional regulator n=1 Tax=Pseudonocardia sp. TRM90224 TaxID=2812678 RepID=UPI001E5EC6CC|nr:TetR/AcrR family transcriptional regulator [Pseudonocardia sp. TRM90224]
METRRRSTRTDARRNEERLLAAAHTMFTEHGTGASLEEIARRAGVGIGTLYRAFPNREALLEALVHERFERLAVEAEERLTEPEPRAAFAQWLSSFAESSATYRGLPASLVATMRDPGSPLYVACHRMHDTGVALFDRCRDAGTFRGDVQADDVLALAAAVAWVSKEVEGDPEMPERLLALVLDAATGATTAATAARPTSPA